jgi:hypothetical protein
MSDFETWEPSNYTGDEPLHIPEPREKPEKWYRDNAAVFHALEEYQRSWEDYAAEYENTNGRPPSSVMAQKNKAAYRRRLCELYGRGEPDPAWLEHRISHLEKRGLAPDRNERFNR